MKRLLPLALLLLASPLLAQESSLPPPPPPPSLYERARAQWEVDLTPSARAELDARFQAIAQQAETLRRELDGLSERDRRRGRLRRHTERTLEQRMQASGTVRGNHGAQAGTNGVQIAETNFFAADAVIEHWAKTGEPITVEHLRKLNEVLGQNLQNNGRAPGTIRQQAGELVAAGRLVYIEGEHVPQALREFVRWVEASRAAGMPAPELAGKAYQRLVSIHPFWDANGRTARLVMNWILRSHGLPSVRLSNVNVAVFGQQTTGAVPAEQAVRLVTEALEANLAERERIVRVAEGGAGAAERSTQRRGGFGSILRRAIAAIKRALRGGGPQAGLPLSVREPARGLERGGPPPRAGVERGREGVTGLGPRATERGFERGLEAPRGTSIGISGRLEGVRSTGRGAPRRGVRR